MFQVVMEMYVYYYKLLFKCFFFLIRLIMVNQVPNKGIASETCGRVSATRFRNTVSDSKMVTPETT